MRITWMKDEMNEQRDSSHPPPKISVIISSLPCCLDYH